MFKLPFTIKHTGFSVEDSKKLEVLFDNANIKLFDILNQRLGTAAKNFKIYIDNQDPVPAILQEKTVRATSASQNVTPDPGYDALSKVVIPAGIILASVAKLTNPTLTTYTAGDVFDPTGMTGTATYSNSATKSLVATDFTCPTTPLEAGMTSVTVSYIEAGVTKEITVDITVS